MSIWLVETVLRFPEETLGRETGTLHMSRSSDAIDEALTNEMPRADLYEADA
jgi:hypothetical protein